MTVSDNASVDKSDGAENNKDGSPNRQIGNGNGETVIIN